MSAPARTEDPVRFLQQALAGVGRGLPKYAQLRQALAAAIEAGCWGAGRTLPTELELVRLTPFSLGTVQRAVRALVDEGYVERVKGRGTFVTERRRGLSQPFLHLRFLAGDGEELLPVYPRVVARSRARSRGEWSMFLGVLPAQIVCVERTFDVGGEFKACSRFYIDARSYPAFDSLSFGALSAANYKLMLARKYNLPPIAYEQTMALGALPAAVCRRIGVRPGTVGAVLRVRARTGKSTPLYYHEIYVPPSARKLRLPDMVLPTGR